MDNSLDGRELDGCRWMGRGETLSAVEYILCMFVSEATGSSILGNFGDIMGIFGTGIRRTVFDIDTHGIIVGNIRTRDLIFCICIKSRGIDFCPFQMVWATRHLSNAIFKKIQNGNHRIMF